MNKISLTEATCKALEGKLIENLALDSSEYINHISKIQSSLRDEAFKIGDYGKVLMPETDEQLDYLIQQTQKAQEALEDFKQFLINSKK